MPDEPIYPVGHPQRRFTVVAGSPLWFDDDGWIEADMLIRAWIARGYLLRGAVTMLAGAGGAGKSMTALGYAVALVLGRAWGRFKPKHACKVLVLNAEDDDDEQKLRLSAMLRQHELSPHQLSGRLMRAGFNEAAGPLVDFDSANGRIMTTPAWDALIQRMTAFKPDVVILDPLIELHNANENDNQALRAVVATFRALARSHKCAIILVHHFRKGSNGTAGDADAVRGAGAIVGATRVTLTCVAMTEEEAGTLNVAGAQRHEYFRIDGAKANYSAKVEAEWFRHTEYELDNGEIITAPVPWLPGTAFGELTSYQLNEALDRMDEGRNGAPYSPDIRRGDLWAGTVLIDLFGLGEAQAGRIIKTWLKTGLLIRDSAVDAFQRKPRAIVRVNPVKRPS